MECELKCEIKKCLICDKYIEYSKQRIIVNHNHYHRCCLDNLWLRIDCCERYKIVNHFLEKQRKAKSILEWFGANI